MLIAPKNIDEKSLCKLIENQYDVGGEELSFKPLGEDSWSYQYGPLWISLRRDLRGHFPEAYEAAAEMPNMGFDFVLAPIPGKDGLVVRAFSGYPCVVFPFITCSTVDPGLLTVQEAATIVAMLTRVHETSFSISLPVETFALSFVQELNEVLATAQQPVCERGPLSSKVHHVLVKNLGVIKVLIAEYEQLAMYTVRDDQVKVPTHGEPISSNILRSGNQFLLADWGDIMLAPPERDWSHLNRSLGVVQPGQSMYMRLYDIKWILSEITEYAKILLDEHTGDDDDYAMWKRLLCYLPLTTER